MKDNTVKRLLNYVLKYKLQLILTLVFAILSNLLFLFSPFLTGRAIDNMISEGNVNFPVIIRIVGILVVMYILSSIFNLFQLRLSNKIGNSTVKDIREEVFEHISGLPVNYYDTNLHGDIMSRFTNDIEFIGEGILQGINQFFSGIIILIGSLIFMLRLNIPMSLIIIFVTPLCILITSYISKMSRKMFREQSRVMGQLNGYIEEIIGNQKIVKAFNYETRSMDKFQDLNLELYKHGQSSQFYSSLTNPSTRFINNISYILVCIVGGIMSINGHISIGKISSFLIYSTQFSKPINEITGIMSQFQLAVASAERVFKILDEEPEDMDSDSIEDVNFKGNIVFEDVCFSYDESKPLIENLNMEIKAGSTVAIVGPTGAGKSTIINLLMRFYELNSGRILIDGIDIKTVKRDSLRRSFGMVLQDSWLFEGSIKENLLYGNPDASEEELRSAIEKSRCSGFIDKLPDGYNTILTKNDGNISQGQKQLLTIGRAMIANPSMLILDEATSNIDTLTEIEIQKGFLDLMEGNTSLIIAHRLSTIKDADSIIVMDKGSIVEVGNHDELLRRGKYYANLYNSQFSEDL